MIKITNQAGVGYSGRLDNKAYLARITGTSDTYGLAREFLQADKVERDSFTKPKYVRTYEYYVGEGLYEEQSQGERSFIVVWRGAPKTPDGTEDAEGKRLMRFVVSAERAEAMAKLLSAGETFDAARLATRTAAP